MNNKILRGIYAITPNNLEPEILFRKVTDLLTQGIRLIQYRDKFRDSEERLKISLKLRQICNCFESYLIINDDPILAKKVLADGVHLGQEDTSYEEARKTLGSKAIIGISCQNHLELALEAQSKGADYVAFGSVFNTNTKSNVTKSSINEINLLVSKIEIPTAIIGGINLRNADQLFSSKANMIALSSGLFDQENTSCVISQLKKNMRY